MWQPEQCCAEYKWGNLQDSFVEKIICQCQVCTVSASFQKKKGLSVCLQMQCSCSRKKSMALLVPGRFYFENVEAAMPVQDEAFP